MLAAGELDSNGTTWDPAASPTLTPSSESPGRLLTQLGKKTPNPNIKTSKKPQSLYPTSLKKDFRDATQYSLFQLFVPSSHAFIQLRLSWIEEILNWYTGRCRRLLGKKKRKSPLKRKNSTQNLIVS